MTLLLSNGQGDCRVPPAHGAISNWLGNTGCTHNHRRSSQTVTSTFPNRP